MRFGHDTGGGQNDWTTQSDHGAFHAAGIPFVYVGVEDHADYHQPTDTADKIAPDFLGRRGHGRDAGDRGARSRSGVTSRRRPMPRPSARAAALTTLAPALDRAYDGFNLTHSTRDPIWTVRRFADPADQEVVAFIAAALAFGRVQSVLQTVDAVLGVMGPSPAAFLRAFTPGDAARFDGLGHRWIRSRDLAALAWQLHQMLRDHGVDRRLLRRGRTPRRRRDGRGGARVVLAPRDGPRPRGHLRAARPVPGVGYFFSRPSSGGACKRLNLFLRWVVRRDAVDLGLWSTVRPAQLIVPLDTHIIRVGRCLGLTRRVSPGWKMAVDITATLRRLAPEDPVRYDFAMCHLGMMGACGFGTTHTNAQCPLHAVCRPKARTSTRTAKGARA